MRACRPFVHPWVIISGGDIAADSYVFFVALSTTSQVPSISITFKRSQTSKRPISPRLSNSGKRIKCLFLILGWSVPLGWCPTCTKLTKQKVKEDLITLRDRSCQYYQIVTSYIKTKSRLVTSKTFFTDINMTWPQNPACSCFSSMQLFCFFLFFCGGGLERDMKHEINDSTKSSVWTSIS